MTDNIANYAIATDQLYSHQPTMRQHSLTGWGAALIDAVELLLKLEVDGHIAVLRGDPPVCSRLLATLHVHCRDGRDGLRPAERREER